MGRGFIAYQLPESQREEWVLYSAFIDYRLPDGTKLNIEQTPAWCPECKRFVVAEEIPTIQFLQAEIERLESGDPDSLQMWAFISNGEPISKRIDELLRRIAWRRQRISPARCLHCGSVEIIAIPCSGEFCHPATGERVIEISSGWADTDSWEAEFSSEGELLSPNSTGDGLSLDRSD